ncbi:hypothetical protein [Roseivivax sp. CAU 1761]
MAPRHAPRRAPDYTNASLAMGLVNLVWMLGLLWAVAGLSAVLLAAVALNWGIGRIARRRGRG